MILFKPSNGMSVGFLVGESVAFLVFGIRKAAFELYNWFPNATRVYEFRWKREFKFYWSERADFTTTQLLRLYAIWIMARLDKYFPIIDCERQAAKAQYFHDKGRYKGMRSFSFRYVNPKAWPIFLMRRFVTSLLSFFFPPFNKKFDNFKTTASHDEASSETRRQSLP